MIMAWPTPASNTSCKCFFICQPEVKLYSDSWGRGLARCASFTGSYMSQLPFFTELNFREVPAFLDPSSCSIFRLQAFNGRAFASSLNPRTLFLVVESDLNHLLPVQVL